MFSFFLLPASDILRGVWQWVFEPPSSIWAYKVFVNGDFMYAAIVLDIFAYEDILKSLYSQPDKKTNLIDN